MKSKKLISIILTVMMLITALPFAIFTSAADTPLSAPSIALEADDRVNGGLKYTITDPNGSGVKSYTVYLYQSSNNTVKKTYENIIAAEDYISLTDAPLGTSYYVKVKAVAASGYADSNISAQSDIVTPKKAISADGITVNGFTTNYQVGDKLNFTNVTLTFKYKGETNTQTIQRSNYTTTIDGSAVTADTVVTSAHNGKTIVFSYGTWTAEKVLSVKNKLATPSITPSIDLTSSGIGYTITDTNAEDNIESYNIFVYGPSSDTVPVHTAVVNADDKTGIITSSNIVLNTSYKLAVKAVSSQVNYNDSDTSSLSSAVKVYPVCTGITIISQPTKLSYNVGEKLNLAGLSVKLTFNDETNTTVNASMFASWGISTDPINGTTLDGVQTYNAKKIKISVTNTIFAETAAISVTQKQIAKPVVTIKSDFINGGLSYTITEADNALVSKYEIKVYSGGSLVKTIESTGNTLTGNIPLSTEITAGTSYSVSVKAITANASNASDSEVSTLSNSASAARKIKSFVIKNNPTKLTYKAGETLNLSGLTLTVTFADEAVPETVDITYADISTYGFTITPSLATKLTAANNKVTISLGALSKDIAITVSGTAGGAVPSTDVTKIVGMTLAMKTKYIAGDKLDLTDLYVYIYRNDSTSISDTVLYSATNFINFGITSVPANGTTLKTTDTAVVLSCNNKTYRIPITVEAAFEYEITDVEVTYEPDKVNYKVGDKLDLEGLEVKITYKTSSSSTSTRTKSGIEPADFAYYGLTVTPADGDTLTATDKSVKITYSSKVYDTFDITIGSESGYVVTDIEIKYEPDDVIYKAGEKLDLDGLEIEITYKKSSTSTREYTDTIEPDEFAYYGIYTTPEDGDKLTTSDDTVTVAYSSKVYDDFDITVTNASGYIITAIDITYEPDETEYDVGDRLDLEGLRLRITYKTSSSSTSTSTKTIYDDELEEYGIMTDPEDGEKLTENDRSVKVYYSSSVYDTFNIVVGDNEITKLKIHELPDKVKYTAGDEVDYSGLSLRVYMGDSTSYSIVDYEDFDDYGIKVVPDGTVKNPYLLTTDDTEILVYAGTYKEGSSKNVYVTFEIEVAERTILGLDIINQPTLTYKEGDKLDLTNLVVKITDNNKKTKNVSFIDFEEYGIKCTPADGTVLKYATHNNKPVTITLYNKTVTTDNIKIDATGELTDIKVKTQPKLSYYLNDTLDLSDMVVTLTYSDKSTVDVTFDKFAEYKIVTDIENGKALTASFDGRKVKLSIKISDSKTLTATTGAISVTSRTLTGLTLSATSNHRDTYREGEIFNLTGLKLTASYADGTTSTVSLKSVTIDPNVGLTISTRKVTVYYYEGGVTLGVSIPVYVYEPVIYDRVMSMSNPFKDVSKTSWYYHYVLYLYSYKMLDLNNGIFNPEAEMTRAMFVDMLYKLNGSPAVTTTGTFKDVPANSPYLKAIEWAAKIGVTTGTSKTTFDPDKTITREQMVTFLYRYATLMGYNVSEQKSLASFPDSSKVDSWALNAMKWAVAKGIIGGTTSASGVIIDPLGTALRSQAVKIAAIFHMQYEA